MDTDIHVRPCARIHTDERRKQNENETRDSRLEHSFCFCELLISYTIAVDYCHYRQLYLQNDSVAIVNVFRSFTRREINSQPVRDMGKQT